MRMAHKSERSQGAARQDPAADASVRNPSRGWRGGAVPAVDAVTAGKCAARQPEHVASAGDDPICPERPGVVISRDQQVELGSRAY